MEDRPRIKRKCWGEDKKFFSLLKKNDGIYC